MRLTTIVPILSLVVVVAACGDDDGGAGPDAAPRVDAAPRPDGAPAVGACTVVVGETAVGLGFPAGDAPSLADYDVVFSAPDGSLLGTVASDAEGRATFDSCVVDTIVTLVVPEVLLTGGPPPVNEVELITYTGIQPGDTAYMGAPAPAASEFYSATLNVAVPADISFAPDANNIVVATPCGSSNVGFSGTPPSNVFEDLDDFCVGPDGMVDVHLQLQEDGEDVATAWVKGIAVTPDMESAVTVPAWTPGNHPRATTIFNIPGDYQLGGIVVQPVLLPELNSFGMFTTLLGPGAPMATLFYYGLDPSFGTVTLSAAQLIQSGGCNAALVGDFLPGATETHTIDVAARIPGFLQSIVVTFPGGRPTLNWVLERAEGLDMGLFVVEFDGPELSGSWLVVTHAPGAGQLAAPQMPESLAAFLPTALDDWSVGAALAIGASYTSYSEVIGVPNPSIDPTQQFVFTATEGGEIKLAQNYCF